MTIDTSISIKTLAYGLISNSISPRYSIGSTEFIKAVADIERQLHDSITYEVTEDEHGKTTKAFVQVQVEVPNV